jgi:hypothetical protein
MNRATALYSSNPLLQPGKGHLTGPFTLQVQGFHEVTSSLPVRLLEISIKS